jgi:hypothetical protein
MTDDFAYWYSLDLPKYVETALRSGLDKVFPSHCIRPVSRAARIEDWDISRNAAGSGARMSLSVRWQVAHLFLKTAAPSIGGGV